MKIGIIGFGDMGQALSVMLEKSFGHVSYQLKIYNRTKEKLSAANLEQHYADLTKLIEESEVIFLAVKPWAFNEVGLDQLPKDVFKSKLFISVMARYSIAQLEEVLGEVAIIRTMPNLAVTKGSGLTAWIANKHVSEDQEQAFADLFFGSGMLVKCKTEDQVDKVVLICGCGPGYLAYWYQEMLRQTVAMGFDEETSEAIVLQTVRGTTDLIDEIKLAQLIKQVSSEKGLTEKIINNFETAGLPEIFRQSLDVLNNE